MDRQINNYFFRVLYKKYNLQINIQNIFKILNYLREVNFSFSFTCQITTNYDKDRNLGIKLLSPI